MVTTLVWMLYRKRIRVVTLRKYSVFLCLLKNMDFEGYNVIQPTSVTVESTSYISTLFSSHNRHTFTTFFMITTQFVRIILQSSDKHLQQLVSTLETLHNTLKQVAIVPVVHKY